MAGKTAVEAEKKDRVIKAGGKKGELVVAALQKNPALSRAQLAEAAECTTGRVGEVVRWLAANGTKEEKALIAKHNESKPKRVAAGRPTSKAGAQPGKSSSKAASGKSETRKPRGAAKKTAAAAKDKESVAS